VINLMPGLRQSDRRLAVALIEHFNRKTGRCDPGIDRLANLLGYCERTVIRATQKPEKAGLFRKVRHGGYSNRNKYEPNWSRFAELETAWRAKLKAAQSHERLACHLHPDKRVTWRVTTVSPKPVEITYLNKPALSGIRTKRRGHSAPIRAD
jgi:hypothetical protein